MPIDPQLRLLLDHISQAPGRPLEELTVPEARTGATLGKIIESMVGTAPATDGVANVMIEDRDVPTPRGRVPIRLYRPRDDDPVAKPLLIWMHGGGFVLGSLDSSDATARTLCAGANMIVASIDYPLAPERPFPAAPEACHAVATWLVDHAQELSFDPAKLAIGGDSAGGNLSAVTALLARQRGGPDFRFQLLIYPIIDLRGSFPSIEENGEGLFLTAAGMRWFTAHYLSGGGNPEDPMASPLYADSLGDQPPTMVVTAEFDPLRDEGEAYAELLRSAGVDVTMRRYDGMLHGFFGMTAVSDRAREIVTEVVAELRERLAA